MITLPQRIRIANYLYGGTPDVNISPANFYFGLVAGEGAGINDQGTITGEVSGGGYARVCVVNSKANWSTASISANICNLVDVTFPESTTAWGTVKAVFLSTNAEPVTGEQALYYVTLSTPKEVPANTTCFFRGDINGSTGDITMSVSN